mmetsp:Transcript_15300/g.32893  ORF Transcript_15300/g.32893 Transcript_15300/m.32893 type:complete len:132 (-) Transcript_15300:1302-1697(-)
MEEQNQWGFDEVTLSNTLANSRIGSSSCLASQFSSRLSSHSLSHQRASRSQKNVLEAKYSVGVRFDSNVMLLRYTQNQDDLPTNRSPLKRSGGQMDHREGEYMKLSAAGKVPTSKQKAPQVLPKLRLFLSS